MHQKYLQETDTANILLRYIDCKQLWNVVTRYRICAMSVILMNRVPAMRISVFINEIRKYIGINDSIVN